MGITGLTQSMPGLKFSLADLRQTFHSDITTSTFAQKVYSINQSTSNCLAVNTPGDFESGRRLVPILVTFELPAMAQAAKRKLVVAGGNGFLGSRICKSAVARGWDVTSIR